MFDYTNVRPVDIRPVIPGQWPNKTIDDGTDDDDSGAGPVTNGTGATW